VGRFSEDLMTQPTDVNVKKREVANPLHLYGELHIPVKAIQMVKKLV
jgi:hypothetical protein